MLLPARTHACSSKSVKDTAFAVILSRPKKKHEDLSSSHRAYCEYPPEDPFQEKCWRRRALRNAIKGPIPRHKPFTENSDTDLAITNGN